MNVLQNLSMFIFTQGVSGKMETITGFGIPQSSLHLIRHVPLMLLLPRSQFPFQTLQSKIFPHGTQVWLFTKGPKDINPERHCIPPRKVKEGPNLIPIEECLPGSSPGVTAEHPGRNPAERVCWEWPCGFPFHNIAWFKPVL